MASGPPPTINPSGWSSGKYNLGLNFQDSVLISVKYYYYHYDDDDDDDDGDDDDDDDDDDDSKNANDHRHITKWLWAIVLL